MGQQMSDLANETIDLGNGLKVDNRLRIGGAVWFEEKAGKSLMEFAKALEQQQFSIRDLQWFLMALLLQSNEGMTEDDARQKINSIDITKAADAMAGALSFEPKNSPPADLTESQASAG